jgi:hypothetical protein
LYNVFSSERKIDFFSNKTMEAEGLVYSTQMFHSSHDEECAPTSKASDIFRPAENPGGRRRVRPVVESASSTSTASTWRYLCAPKYCAVPQFLETEATKEYFVSKDVVNANDIHAVRYPNRNKVLEKHMLSADSGIVIPDCSDDEVSDYMSYDSSVGKEEQVPVTRRKIVAVQKTQYDHISDPTPKDIEEGTEMQVDSNQDNSSREKESDECVTPIVVKGENVNNRKVRMTSKVVSKRVATVPIVVHSEQESSTRSGMTDNSLIVREVKIPKSVDAGVMKRRVYAEIVDDSSFGCPAAESFDDDASNFSSDSFTQINSKKNTVHEEESRDVIVEPTVPKEDAPRQAIEESTINNLKPVDQKLTPAVFGADNLFPPNITSLGWIPKLIIFLSSDKSEIVEAALIELAKVADTDVDPSDEETVVVIRKKIKNVSIDEKEKRSQDAVIKDIALAFQYGVHASVIGVMNKWFRYPEIQLLACSTLHAFGAINENFRFAAYGLGALEALLQAMHNFRSYPEIQSQCCACLCCYSTNLDVAKHLLANLNGLQTILQTMYEHPENTFLQMWCCSALEYMTSCPTLKPYLPSNDTVKALLHVSGYFNDSTNTDHCLISYQAQTAIERLIPTVK